MTEHIVVRDENATRTISMHRPDKKNALTQAMYLTMSAAIDSAQADSAIRCLVITGTPGTFTAGNDLEDFLKAGTSADGTARPSAAMTFLRSLANNTKPLVAAVDGFAVGIGTTMVFHCDYVIASTQAKFSTPFIHLGLVPEGASSLLVPRAMGHHRAFAMLVMGRTISATDAREAGFVNDVVAPDQLGAQTKKVTQEICALPAEAVAISRKLLKPAPEEVITRIEKESALFGERMRSAEAIGAFQSFLARKRA
ncbi:MAG: crotonase/enoyl-CoA hydratase family protein [Pseudomonadota bacterium]